MADSMTMDTGVGQTNVQCCLDFSSALSVTSAKTVVVKAERKLSAVSIPYSR